MKRKILSMIMTMALAASVLAGCGSTAEEGTSKSVEDNTQKESEADNEDAADASQNDASAADGQTFKIGVIQLAEHPALDASYEGFIEGLKEAGFEEGKNLTIDYQNAQGEQANCQTISEKFVNDGVDLILAIATPAAQAAASKTTEIPILVTAVTDPASSGLIGHDRRRIYILNTG